MGLFLRARQADRPIDDLAGNVLEWCDSWFDPADKENPQAARVLRGGSWGYAQVDAGSTGRIGGFPNYWLNDVGFRVVCASPIFGR